MFNISVSSVLTDATESASSIKATPAMEADTTSGKRNICKNFINNELRVTNMHLDICQKWKVWE